LDLWSCACPIGARRAEQLELAEELFRRAARRP